MHRECACNRDALLLAAGESFRIPVRLFFQADRFE
jgi:hypothetical protein